MRISDWSSDVCSSDLNLTGSRATVALHRISIAVALPIEPEPFRAVDAELGAGVPVEDALDGHVAQRAGDHHGLRHLGDDADGVDLLGVDLQDLLPGRHLLFARAGGRSEEHTSELQSLMRISYAVFCLKKKNYFQHTQQHRIKYT